MMTLLLYFSLTFTVSWVFFVGAAMLSGPLAFPVRLIGVFAPALVALALIARAEGSAGVARLLNRIVVWPEAARWYAFALGLMIAIKLTAAVLHRVMTGGWPWFGNDSLVLMLAATIVSTPVQAGEEIGWRGYALPRLAARFRSCSRQHRSWRDLGGVALAVLRDAGRRYVSSVLSCVTDECHGTVRCAGVSLLANERKLADDDADACGHQQYEGHRAKPRPPVA